MSVLWDKHVVLREETLSSPPFEDDHKKVAYVECMPCDAESPKSWESDKEVYGDDYDYIADAIKTWNTRHTEAILTKKVETLRGALEFIAGMGDDPDVNETISADAAIEALEATK